MAHHFDMSPLVKQKKLTPPRISKKCHKKLMSPQCSNVPCESYNNMVYIVGRHILLVSRALYSQSGLESECKYSPVMIPSTLHIPPYFCVGIQSCSDIFLWRKATECHWGPHGFTMSFQPRHFDRGGHGTLKCSTWWALLWATCHPGCPSQKFAL